MRPTSRGKRSPSTAASPTREARNGSIVVQTQHAPAERGVVECVGPLRAVLGQSSRGPVAGEADEVDPAGGRLTSEIGQSRSRQRLDRHAAVCGDPVQDVVDWLGEVNGDGGHDERLWQ